MTPQATTPPSNGVLRVPIDEAARILGVSRPTIRRRLRSGGLKGTQVSTPHGPKWLVEVPTPHDSPVEESATPQGSPAENPTGGQATPTREVELLQAHVDDLRRQLEDRTREVRELHTLLAQAQQQAQRLLTDSQLGGRVSTHGDSAGTQAESPAPESSAPETPSAPPPKGGLTGRRWWRWLWGLDY
jgi:excisionase family DNA binding protein